METYTQLSDKPFSSSYVYVDAVLECPLAKVWAQALNIESWMDAHRMESVDRASGEVGHFCRVFPGDLDESVPEPRYYLYGVANLVPERMIALEVFPEKGGSLGEGEDWRSFDFVIFAELEKFTKVIFAMVDVHDRLPGDVHKKDDATTADPEAISSMLNRYFDNLAGRLSCNRIS